MIEFEFTQVFKIELKITGQMEKQENVTGKNLPTNEPDVRIKDKDFKAAIRDEGVAQ